MLSIASVRLAHGLTPSPFELTGYHKLADGLTAGPQLIISIYAPQGLVVVALL